MSRITWCNSVGGLPQCDNARGWRSHNKITRQQAQDVLRAMLDDLIEECGRDSAVDSGFRMECR